MRKVMTVVGTRPELIKMSLVIGKLDSLFEHILVHTGQNFDYELNQIFFDDLGLRKPDYFLDTAGASPAETIANIISRSDAVFAKEAPDALLIYGDTNSGLCVIPAKRRKIPVFHMEAGNRCFDQRVPEELNRKVIDHLSDINMVLTEHARRYLLAEGLPGDRIFNVGSHLAEVLTHYRSKIDASDILTQLGLTADRFLVVSAHREENVDVPQNLQAFLAALNGLASTFGFPVVVSTHPRTRQRLAMQEPVMQEPATKEEEKQNDLIRFLPPFAFTDYIKLQMNAFCVISDSGTITEEASLLDFPAVTVRDAHERPEGMDAGVLVRSSFALKDLVEAVRIVRAGFGNRKFSGRVVDYEMGSDVSSKVVRILASYIDYVNRVVWAKSGTAR